MPLNITIDLEILGFGQPYCSRRRKHYICKPAKKYYESYHEFCEK